jgi:hypothetical protein
VHASGSRRVVAPACGIGAGQVRKGRHFTLVGRPTPHCESTDEEGRGKYGADEGFKRKVRSIRPGFDFRIISATGEDNGSENLARKIEWNPEEPNSAELRAHLTCVQVGVLLGKSVTAENNGRCRG